MLSYKCADSKVTNDAYGTFARTFPSDRHVIHSVLNLTRYYNWSKFSVVYENTEPYSTVATSLLEKATNVRMNGGSDSVLSDTGDKPDGSTSGTQPHVYINSHRTFENFYRCCETKLSCCKNPFFDIISETNQG